MTVPLAQQLEALWDFSDSPPDVFEFLQQHNGLAGDDVLGVLLTDQNHRWKTDSAYKVEDYFERLPNRQEPLLFVVEQLSFGS